MVTGLAEHRFCPWCRAKGREVILVPMEMRLVKSDGSGDTYQCPRCHRKTKETEEE